MSFSTLDTPTCVRRIRRSNLWIVNWVTLIVELVISVKIISNEKYKKELHQ